MLALGSLVASGLLILRFKSEGIPVETRDLTWTDGFTGVTLKLEKKGDKLSGWAHPHFDAVKIIPRRARVVARPIACDAP